MNASGKKNAGPAKERKAPGPRALEARNPDFADITFRQTGMKVPEELWEKMHLISDREKISLQENLYYALKYWVTAYEKKYGPLTTSREFNFAEELIRSL